MVFLNCKSRSYATALPFLVSELHAPQTDQSQCGSRVYDRETRVHIVHVNAYIAAQSIRR